MRTRAFIAGLALLLGLAGAQLLVSRTPAVTVEQQHGLWMVVDGEWQYSFDAVWREERLVRVDPGAEPGARAAAAAVDRLASEPEIAARLRARLLAHLGVDNVAAIPTEGATEVEALRALGYI